MGKEKVDGAGDILSLDEKFDSADEVGLMDPGHVLVAGQCCAAEALAHQLKEDIEDTKRSRSMWSNRRSD